MSLLADSLLKTYSKPLLYKRSGGFASDLAQARKFSLDAEASCFCLDVAESANTDALRMELRKLAKLPYPHCWIEYDAFARNNYACDLNKLPRSEMVDSPKRIGYILHEGKDGILAATECFSHCFDRNQRIVDSPNMHYISMLWTTEEGVKMPVKGIGTSSSDPVWWHPQSKRVIRGMEEGLRDVEGLSNESYISVVFNPYYDPKFSLEALHQETFGPEQHRGSLKFLWAILATINQVPVGMTEFRPSKGQMVAGSYKRFMEHKVVSITIPAKRFNTVKKLVSHAKRRAHQVRGHWRKPRKDSKNPEAATLWIASHQRGDASIGFVTHDYEVKHD